MNKRTLRTAALYTGALLLFAAIAIAQSKPAPKSTPAPKTASAQQSAIVAPRDIASGQSSGRKSGQVNSADFKVTADASTDRQHQPAIVTSDKSLGSAHAVESVYATPGQSDSGSEKAASNPIYKDNTNQGTNQLYQGKDKNAAAPAPSKGVDGLEHSHETVEYKDPEDMTTRYRPGNNKTTKSNKPAPSSASSNK